MTDEQTACPIPAEICTALNSAGINTPSRAILQTYITISGLKFAIASKHSGNSYIIVSSESRHPQPAQLVYILEFGMPNTPSTYLTIRWFKPANISCDPFAKYPIVHAKLWDSSLASAKSTLSLEHPRLIYGSYNTP